jgi:hypothetical protein
MCEHNEGDVVKAPVKTGMVQEVKDLYEVRASIEAILWCVSKG